MIGNKKVIGVCMTLIFNRLHSEFLNLIKEEAARYDCKVITFNSVVDFYNHDSYDDGARAIYENINFDIVDSLIILADNFHDRDLKKDTVSSIIAAANAANKPVIVVAEEYENSICFLKDYEEAFKELMNHVIQEHGVKDTFFLAGRADGDPESINRIRIYKEVLEENGLPFSDEQVDYGGYWATPTRDAMNRLLQSGRKLPEVIFCANDYMAFAACEILVENGYKIPEDIFITGFDGVPEVDFFSPKLSTCKEDIPGLVRDLVQVSIKEIEKREERSSERNSDKSSENRLENRLDNSLEETRYKEKFRCIISESCGCGHLTENMIDIRQLFYMKQEMEDHEAQMQSWLDKMLECKNYNQMADVISRFLLPNSFVCISQEFIDFVTESSDKNNKENNADIAKLTIISPFRQSLDELDLKENIFDVANVIPDLHLWNDDSVYVLTSLFIGDKAFGYYAARISDDVCAVAHKINRIARVLNIAFNALKNNIQQKQLKVSVENAAITKPITGLPNLRGAELWFEKFSADENVHNSPMAVSVFVLPKYKYIYENYGIRDIEDALSFIAYALKLSNSIKSFIAHTSDDAFLVVNYGDTKENLLANAQRVISDFEQSLQQYNKTSDKDYYLEVNYGSSIIDEGWIGSLAGFLKMATGEMYVNRVKKGMKTVHKENLPAAENYEAFSALIEKNMFRYCFQPIVDAKTGNIFAYEALMRTDASIGMNPMQVLEIAESYERLYDIERATMFNVMERYAEELETFKDKHVFINHIPGYALNSHDYAKLCERHSDYMDNFVFEITEQNTITEDELDGLKHMGGRNSMIAVDDYGTGHSNIVNLLRYTPQIIKIDRFLITDIDKDLNKQMFVKSTIDFARMNNIQILAEGVETLAEMNTVIEFGVDYIQGYYTGKPAFEPITEIDEKIRQEIRDANPLFKYA